MEDSLGEQVGQDNKQSYHHVLGGSAGDGDRTFETGEYPGAGTEVYCLSCHVDHDQFNADKGANLRSDLSSVPVAARSDFDPETGGVCLGCHETRLPKDMVDRATNGTTITPEVDRVAFDQSAHQYQVSGQFGESEFKGDCVKCHNTGLTRYQTGRDRFAMHASAESRLLQALGAAPGAGVEDEEATCFRCHAGDGAGMDVFDEATMSAGARGIKRAFSSDGSHHGVGLHRDSHRSNEASDSARHVECEDCHNTHQARSGERVAGSSDAGPALLGARGAVPTWPNVVFGAPVSHEAITFNGAAGQAEAYLCFRCHSKTLVGQAWPQGSVTTTSGTYTPTDVAAEFNPANASGHNAVSASTWPKVTFENSAGFTSVSWELPAARSWLKPEWDSTSQVGCTDCHGNSTADESAGPHGSASKWLLDPAFGGDYQTSYLSETGLQGRPICAKCHTTDETIRDANNVHSVEEHWGADAGKCVNCHSKLPHGGQRPRMIGYTSDGETYGSLKVNNMSVREDRTPYNWVKSDCGTTEGCHDVTDARAPLWP
jgi:hypothetical protein